MTGQLFVGRDRQVAELRSGLDDALAGHGTLFMIDGESGIGKTRLAHELAVEAAQRGARVVWGSAWEAGGAPPFWPWVQVLRELVGQMTDSDRPGLRDTLAASAPYVAQLVPDVRAALPDLPPAPALESEQARFGLFDAIATFLRERAREHPLVLVLDDLQWADEPSLLLARFVARTLHNVPLMAMATYRETDTAGEPGRDELLGSLRRAARRISLGGLPDDAVRRLVASHTDGAARPGLARRVTELTRGNPLFVDELLRMLVLEGRLDDAEGPGALPLPAGMRETIRRRLEPLPVAVHDVLEVAAVIGIEFDLETVAGVAQLDPETLLELLDQAVEAGVVRELDREIARWGFGHAMVRETLYESLGAHRRAHLHRRIAENLEQRYLSAAARDLSSLAYHYLEASPIGDPGKALEYAVAAGDQAMRVLAYEHAQVMFRQALRALELLGVSEERRCRLLISLGEAQSRAGDQAQGRETLREALDLARELGDGELLARAALRFAPWGLSTAVVDEEFVAVLQEALDQLAPTDRPQHARLLAHLAAALYWEAPAEQRLALVEEAITAARQAGDAETLALVLVEAHIATWDPDSVERSLPWAQEILALAERTGKPELALHAHTWRVSLMLEAGDLLAADHSIEAIAQLAGVLNEPRARAYVPLVRALRALLDGRIEEAEMLNERAGALTGEVTQDAIVPMLVASQLFWIRLTQGRLHELEPALRHLAETYPMIPSWRCALVACLHEMGRTDELRRELDHLGADGFAAMPRDNVWLVGLALLADACATVGDARRAETLEGLLAPFGGRHIISPIAAYVGPVNRYLGLLALAREDYDEAVRRLSAAHEEAASLGARPALAVIALDQARAHAARGEREDSAERAREAGALASDLGLHALAERAAALTDPAPAPEAATRPATAGALRSEGEVWRLQWQGRSLLLRDSKGLRYLAQLLSAPGVEVHSLDLIGAPAGARSLPPRALADDELQPRLRGDEAIGALDEQAKREYRQRLDDLREELEQAEDWGDIERAASAREEMQAIAHELAAAVGLGGRDRPTGSTSERARVNATRAIRGAIARIGQSDPALGHHLATTVKTGVFCSYQPGPGMGGWDVG